MTVLQYSKKVNNLFKVACFVLVAAAIIGCAEKQTYDEIVAEEMASGIKKDSLFHGLYFNMSLRDFYQHCFEMNQKGIFFQNDFNVEIITHYEEDFSAPVDFVFFPEERGPTIQKVIGYMKYSRWAPFSEKYSSGRLLEEVKAELEEWYPGRSFIKIAHPEGHWPYAYVKVDGNRKIMLYRSFEDQKVEMIFENLDTVE